MILSCKSWSSLLISELRSLVPRILHYSQECSWACNISLWGAAPFRKEKSGSRPIIMVIIGVKKKSPFRAVNFTFISHNFTYIKEASIIAKSCKKWMVASSTSEINQQWIVCFYRKWSMHYCYSKKLKNLFEYVLSGTLVVSKVTAVHSWFKIFSFPKKTLRESCH